LIVHKNKSPQMFTKSLLFMFVLTATLAIPLQHTGVDTEGRPLHPGIPTVHNNVDKLNRTDNSPALANSLTTRPYQLSTANSRCSLHVTLSQICEYPAGGRIATGALVPYIRNQDGLTIAEPGWHTNMHRGGEWTIRSRDLPENLMLSWKEDSQRLEFYYGACTWGSTTGKDGGRCGDCKWGDYTG
jgi:hypothetical protein